MSEIKLSFFQSVTDQIKAGDRTLEEYSRGVLTGSNWKETLIKARTEFQTNGKTKLYDSLKKKLPCFTASCTTTIEGRSAKHVAKINGYIVLDIDLKENLSPEIYEGVKNDRYTKIVHKSPSGSGFCVFVKINPLKFVESFLGLEKYYAENFNLEIDKSCKNVNRLRFASFDEELHENETSDRFTEYLKPLKVPKNLPSIIYTEDELSQYVQRIVDNGQPIDGDSYQGWVACAHAISSVESGMSGFLMFDALSKLSMNYDAQQTLSKWESCNGDGSIGIGTLYHFGQQLGIKQRYSDNMTKMVQLATNHKKQSGKAATVQGAKDYIQTISPEIVANTEVIQQILNSEFDYSKGLSNDSEINQLEQYVVDNYSPRIDAYTGATEINGEPITDRKRNGIIIDCMNVFDGKFTVKDGDVDKILNSPNIPTFDAIDEFLQANKDLETNGSEIQKLCDCLTLNKQSNEFKETFLKKWLVSWFAYKSFEGYSPLTLVFSGGQNLGKTYFFRHLLPKSLATEFYAENQLTGKLEDIFQIMSKSLIIVNDEFSVSTKKSAESFKELVSKSDLSYRKPYGREIVKKKRISVFAGTTNNTNILVDSTGNRRIIVFDLLKIDRAIYNDIDTNTLFVEVFRLWQSNENGFTVKAEDVALLNKETADMESTTTEEEALSSEFEICNPEQGLQIREILSILNGDGTMINYKSGLIRSSLVKLGYTPNRIGGKKGVYNIKRKPM
jgi:hypothetical protein